MRKSIALLSILSAMLILAPSAHAASEAARVHCESKTSILLKLRCIRQYDNASRIKRSDTQRYTERNRGAVLKQRRARRSDIKDRSMKKLTDEERREKAKARLAERRKTADNSQSVRKRTSRQRLQRIRDQHKQQLRARTRDVSREKALTRSQFRSRSRDIDDGIQEKREAMKEARLECMKLWGAERRDCYEDARERIYGE